MASLSRLFTRSFQRSLDCVLLCSGGFSDFLFCSKWILVGDDRSFILMAVAFATETICLSLYFLTHWIHVRRRIWNLCSSEGAAFARPASPPPTSPIFPHLPPVICRCDEKVRRSCVYLSHSPHHVGLLLHFLLRSGDIELGL